MACRQRFDLKTKIGWKNCIERKFDKWSRQHILADTFYEMLCYVVGHKTYQTEDKEYACKRCCRYVKSP